MEPGEIKRERDVQKWNLKRLKEKEMWLIE